MKRGRDIFLYMEPKGSGRDFAQCATCSAFNPKGRCVLFGKSDRVIAGGSCGLYTEGKNSTTEPMGLVTPREAGYVERKVRCENCGAFERGHCHFFAELEKKVPGHFDLGTAVKPQACCNAQMPSEGGRVAASRQPIAEALATAKKMRGGH